MALQVLARTAYPASCASARVRALEFIPFLGANGVSLRFDPSMTDEEYARSTTGGVAGAVALGVASRRAFAQARHAPDADVTLLHRLPSLVQLPTLDRRLAGDVFDFDDAIFLPPRLAGIGRYRGWLKREHDRWAYFVRSSRLTLAGNPYLADAALKLTRSVEVVPSCVDHERFQTRMHHDGPELVVGWIGSPTTSKYLLELLPVIDSLNRAGKRVRLTAVGADLGSIRAPWLEVVPWSAEQEARQLARFDVGVMPLPDDPWTRGKCGYKILQYFAAGLPVVGSPVGINTALLADGRGMLARTQREWQDGLLTFGRDVSARAETGRRNRTFVAGQYSFQAWAPKVAALLRDLAS